MGCNHSTPAANTSHKLHPITPSARVQPLNHPNLQHLTPLQLQQYLQQQHTVHTTIQSAPVKQTGALNSPTRAPALPPLDVPRKPVGKLEPLGNKLHQPQLIRKPSSMKATVCDNDASHVAVLHCKQCDESFCSACDATIHNRPKTRDHQRAAISSEGNTLNAPAVTTRELSDNISRSSVVDVSDSDTSDDNIDAAALKRRAKRAAKRKQKKLIAESMQNDPSDTAPTRFIAKDFTRQKTIIPSASHLSPQPTHSSSSQPIRPHTPNPSPAPQHRSSQISSHPAQPQRHGNVAGDNYLNSVPIDKLRVLGAEQLNAIWNQYDCDGNGILDRKELKLLANDCIGRTIKMFADEIRQRNPGISEKNLQRAIDKERVFLLPGKNSEDSHREMTKLLIRKLDVNGDGGVTKQELMAQWREFSNEVFAQKNQEALECSIM